MITKWDMSHVQIIILPILAGILGIANLVIMYTTRIQSVVIPTEEGDEGFDKEKQKRYKHLIEISSYIRDGAMAFLKKEYTYLLVFVIIMGTIVGLITKDATTIIAFVFGAALSASCGWIGMYVATIANAKTTYKAEAGGLNESLKVAFASGAVMGFGVVSSGIIGLTLLYAIVQGLSQEETRYLAGFGFGASAIALFARVGGGIYTKAADVGADLVGKVEAGLDEDSPRNPATIADNVGDNVGDVAGMGADLFESFVGSIIAAIQLSASYASQFHVISGDDLNDTTKWTDEMKQDVRGLIGLPFWIAGLGIIVSCCGIYTIRTSKEADFQDKTGEEKVEAKNQLQENLLWIIRRGIFFTSFLSSICSLIVCACLFGTETNTWVKMWACTAIGLVSGVLIGIFTEYATAYTYKPTQTIAKKSKLGPAPVVIQGLGIGMLSTMGPTIIIFIAILSCYRLAETYGIAIAAVGMLSTLGVTLATDAFGPVADNAGGLAEMCEFPEEVRETTDGLDSLGNTTAATGKGFAIGSAVLSALALLSAYKQDVNITVVDVSKSEVLAGAIWGSCLPFIFAALTMMAVGRAATMMIEEVRRQIREFDLLNPESTKIPEYNQCVSISTEASVVEMIIPGVLAVASPLFIGYLLGPEALGGMLVGGITCGFMVAVFMANAGGAWDNAKKYVEAGQLQHNHKVVKKGSDEHAAVVTGDTIGDPFKDTSGPALNILMKLMTMISLVFAKDQFRGLEAYEKWWVALIIGVVFTILAVSLTMYMRAQGFGKMKDYSVEESPAVNATGGESKEINPETQA